MGREVARLPLVIQPGGNVFAYQHRNAPGVYSVLLAGHGGVEARARFVVLW